MKLMTAASIEQMKVQAGGPGSGRKPGFGGVKFPGMRLRPDGSMTLPYRSLILPDGSIHNSARSHVETEMYTKPLGFKNVADIIKKGGVRHVSNALEYDQRSVSPQALRIALGLAKDNALNPRGAFGSKAVSDGKIYTDSTDEVGQKRSRALDPERVADLDPGDVKRLRW